MQKERVNGEILSYFLAILFVLAFPSDALSAKPAPPSRSTKAPESEAKILIEPKKSAIPIKEEVKILRAERRQKMPYLDRGHLKEAINPETVRRDQAFALEPHKSLDDVISRATDVWTPARAAKEKIKLGRRRILLAARDLFPGMTFNFEDREGRLSGDPFTGQDFHLAFRIPVFRGGILWNTFRQYQAEYRAAKKEYEGVLNELVEEVSKAYFEFNRAQEVLKDKSELWEKAKAKRRLSGQKHQEGLISEIEYLNAESLTGQAEYDLETAEGELELARLELQYYLDLEVWEPIEITPLYNVNELIEKTPLPPQEGEASEKKPGLGASLQDFIDLAYRHHPELQAEAEKLRAARLKEQVRRGDFLPRADALIEFGEMGEAFTRVDDDPPLSHEWRLMFEVSNNLFGNKIKYTYDIDANAPSVSQFLQSSGSRVRRNKLEVGLLDGLKEYVELKDSQVKRLEQVVELEKKEREVIKQVKEAYFDYHKAQVQTESSLKLSQYRRKLVEVSQLKLDKAEAEISEYLQAEIDLGEARGRLHKALADLAKAKSKLNRAVGIRNYLPLEERYGI